MSLSQPLIVRSSTSTSRWLSSPPSADVCRPPQCPRCGCATYSRQGQLQLHGHGFRQRVLMHMQDARCEPQRVVVQARRFLCRQCKSTCLVVPSGVLAHRRYTASSIGALLAREVEERRSHPFAYGARRPDTVRRWIRRSAASSFGVSSPNEHLHRLAYLLAAGVSSGAGLAGDAHLGAVTHCDPDQRVNVCILPAHQLGSKAGSTADASSPIQLSRTKRSVMNTRHRAPMNKAGGHRQSHSQARVRQRSANAISKPTITRSPKGINKRERFGINGRGG